MKTIKLLLTLLVAGGAGMSPFEAQSSLETGLVAFYPFNGNAMNSIGESHHGTVNGATLVADRQGHANSAYRFDGIDDRIDFGSVPLTQVDNWTLAAWINPATFNQTGIAVMMGKDSGSGADGYGMGFQGNATWTALFSGINWPSSGFVIPATNQWYHCVMLRATGTTKFFINGVQTPLTSSLTPYAPTKFSIGAQDGGRHFNGLVDDVRVYNRALSDAEVQQLQNYNEVCTPHRARATAIVVNGFVVGATLVDRGCGYTNAPQVLLQGGGGSGATATAIITDDYVSSIQINTTGCCYTNLPTVLIDYPPMIPTVSIQWSKVKVTQGVAVGRKYVLESSTNMLDWTPTGPPFTATNETIINEFDVDITGRFFRILQVP